jgi:hypothetical protein
MNTVSSTLLLRAIRATLQETLGSGRSGQESEAAVHKTSNQAADAEAAVRRAEGLPTTGKARLGSPFGSFDAPGFRLVENFDPHLRPKAR